MDEFNVATAPDCHYFPKWKKSFFIIIEAKALPVIRSIKLPKEKKVKMGISAIWDLLGFERLRQWKKTLMILSIRLNAQCRPTSGDKIIASILNGWWAKTDIIIQSTNRNYNLVLNALTKAPSTILITLLNHFCFIFKREQTTTLNNNVQLFTILWPFHYYYYIKRLVLGAWHISIFI